MAISNLIFSSNQTSTIFISSFHSTLLLFLVLQFKNQQYILFTEFQKILIKILESNMLPRYSYFPHKQDQTHQQNEGRWDQTQNSKFYAFIVKFRIYFQGQGERRQFKVFKAMATFIATRDANQCRGHYHKLIKCYKALENVLDHLKSRYQICETQCNKYQKILRELSIEDIAQGKFQQNPEEVDQHLKIEPVFHMKTSAAYQNPYYRGAHQQNFHNFFPPFEDKPNLNSAIFFPQHGYQPEQNPPQTFLKTHIDNSLIQKKTQQCQQSFEKWWIKLNQLIKEEDSNKDRSHHNPPNNTD